MSTTKSPPNAVSTNNAPMADGIGPLNGLRIIDMSTTFMGPVATMHLARLGADVVKLEAPAGDPPRYIGKARSRGMGPIFINGNTGKRSIVLDLKQPVAQRALTQILKSADIFVHNLRPKAEVRLGLDAARLMDQNPRLIHCSMRGYGNGPYQDEPAYDDVVQGLSGIASVQGKKGAPEFVVTPMVDKTMGMAGAMAILAAVVRRQNTGVGEAVIVPMFECMVSWLLLEQQGGWVFDPPNAPTGYERVASPDRRPYRTSDGYIAILLYTDRQWLRFFTFVGRPELAKDPRFADIGARVENSNVLLAWFAEEISRRTTSEWLAIFKRESIAAMPVNTIEGLFEDPHLIATGFFEAVDHPTEGPLKIARVPFSYERGVGRSRPAPRIGEHTREVLLESGCSPSLIDELLGVAGKEGDS